MTKPIIFFLVWVSLVHGLIAQNLPKDGILDLRDTDLGSKRISLSGDWLWLDGKLIEPNDPLLSRSTPIKFPTLWNDVRGSALGQGVATYSLTVLLPSETKEYAIEMPQVYSGYSLWANSELIGKNGTVGLTETESIPQWMPQVIHVSASDSLKLILQIANFHHNKGGCKELIYFGSSTVIASKEKISTISKIIECGLLIAISLGFFSIFLAGKRRKVIVYFALLCATWAVRSSFSNEYLSIKFFPDFDWDSMVRIEYITLYLTMIWAILFISRLFTNESNSIIKYILVILNSVFVVFTLFNSPLLFTKMLALYLFTSGLLLAYALLIIVKAYINERAGAAFLSVSSLVGIFIFTFDIFAYEGIFTYKSVLFSLAYLTMFSMLGLALLLHIDIIKKAKSTSSTLTYKDLYGDQKK